VVDTATGAVAQRIDYDEWGNVTQNTNPGFQPFGFGGGLVDDQTGLVRFGARDYDPMVGRWTARDPVLFKAGDANLYRYVFGNPTNMVDPTGLDVTCVYSISGGVILCWDNTTGMIVVAHGGLYSGGFSQRVADCLASGGLGCGFDANAWARNNPFATNVPNVGPIPEGVYRIEPGKRVGSDLVLPLTPVEPTWTYGRFGFEWHGERGRGEPLGRASMGCIVSSPRWPREVVNALGGGTLSVTQ